MKTNIEIMFAAWLAEPTMRSEMKHPVDMDIQSALAPPGGDWQCIAATGAITRSIIWRRQEVALINPRGDLDDSTEGDIAMGIRATPIMDTALRIIFSLALGIGDGNEEDWANERILIGEIARAAIDYVEQPAPAIVEPDEDEEAGAD